MLTAVLGVSALVLAGALALPFLRDSTRLAPTRDPVWYTWRTQVVLEDGPAVLLEKDGPLNMLAGGYRVTTPVLGALVHRVAGVETFRFASLFMVALPVLIALALGAFAYQHRRDPIAFLLTLFFAFGMLLTVPFVGYMDQVMVLYLLALSLPFLEPARTSWGARSALAMLLLLASLTHPSTTMFFALVLAAATGLGWLLNRFSVRATIREYGPAVLSAAVGVVVGLAFWRLGLWGPRASFSDAVLVQPYPQSFFQGRLGQWWESLRPRYTVPLAVIAVGWFAWRLIRRRGADWHMRMSVLWLLPLLGVYGYVLDLVYPYYRFFNTSLALLLLGGTGAWVITRAVRWGADRIGERWGILQAVAGGVIVLFLVNAYIQPGVRRWTNESQFMGGDLRVTLASLAAYAEHQPEHPIVVLTHPKAEKIRAWAFAKLNANEVMAGVGGAQVERTFVYVGTAENLAADRPTATEFPVFDRLSREFLSDVRAGVAQFPAPPIVFLVKGINSKYETEQLYPGVQITPELRLLLGPDWGGSSEEAAAAAVEARDRVAASLAHPPPRFANKDHLIRVAVGLFLLLVLPGLLAWRWFGLRGLPSMLALLPGLSMAMVVLSGILVIAVSRGPFGPPQAWASVLLATAGGAALGVAAWRRDRRSGSRGAPGEAFAASPAAAPDEPLVEPEPAVEPGRS